MIKLLLVSRFPPSLGGLETMGQLIAQHWAKEPGITLKVVTDCPGPASEDPGYELVRCPDINPLRQLYQWADVVFLNHCYLKLALPLAWIHKPYVVSMSGTLVSLPGNSRKTQAVRWVLKQQLRRATRNIAACRYVLEGNEVAAEVIPNPYDDAIYFDRGNSHRPFNFFFGGRLNQDAKGCLDLVDAFAACCRETGLPLTLSVAGEGPDRSAMEQQVKDAGLEQSVRFLGMLKGEVLAEAMGQHQVIVVPSRYQEPIGIICLEGIACGCIAVGSEGGGLGESVGPCGFTFPNGQVTELTKAMCRAVSLDLHARSAMREKAKAHLAGYSPHRISQSYLRVIHEALSA